jgi:hypothetical protein
VDHTPFTDETLGEIIDNVERVREELFHVQNCLEKIESTMSEGRFVEGPNAERWRELCAQVAVEKDPDKLLVMIKEINRLLEEN